MADPPTAQTQTPEAKPEPLWAFNRDDTKLLVVTLLGTLAANMLTLAAVAIAILLASALTRPSERFHYPGKVDATASSLAIVVTVAIVGAILAVVTARAAKRVRRRTSRRRVLVGLAVAFGAVSLIFVLALLGLFAGVG
jgi:ABC-type Fe3+ transport system permease subunit